MSTDVQLPAAVSCSGHRCDAAVITLPTWGGSLVRLDARPHAKGRVYIHAGPGHTVAQTLHEDAVTAFHKARLPLYRRHECEKEAKA